MACSPHNDIPAGGGTIGATTASASASALDTAVQNSNRLDRNYDTTMTSNNDPWAKLRADVFAAFMACGTGGTGTAGSYVDINATESNESPGHVGAGTSVEHVTSGSTRAEVDSQLGSDTSAGSATSSDQSVIRRMVDEAVDRADKANRVQLQSLVKDNDALKMEVEALKAVVENNNPMTDVKVLTEAVNKLVKENQDLVEKNQDLVKENEDLKHKLKAFTVKIENDANATKREPDEEFKGLIIYATLFAHFPQCHGRL